MLYIDDTRMPNPSKYDITMSDLDSSESSRSESGILLRNRIRQGVLKIALAWTVRGDKVATILKAIEPAEFSVRYFNPRTGEYGNAQMYASDRSCVMKLYSEGMDISEILWEVSFNLIEY